MNRLLWAAPVIILIAACTVSLSEPEGRACDAEHPCAAGLSCQGGSCVLDEGGNTANDSGVTGGAQDSGIDASVGKVDAGFDAGLDAGTDGGQLPPTDGGWNPDWDGGYPPNTFFVDPAGDDANDGRSETTAWRTVSKVNGAALPAGSVVLFKGGGVWNESLAPTRSGLQGAPILFSGYGAGRPVLDGTGSTGNSALNANGKSWLVFRGFELRNWRGGFQLIYMANTHNVAFDQLWMHDAEKGFHASPSAPSTNISITHTLVEEISGGSFTHALSAPVGGTGWLIADSRFSNIEQSCVIDSADGTTYLRNTFSDCGKLTATSDRHGVYLRGPNAVVRDNHIYDVAGSCVFVAYEGATIENNQLHGCAAAGLEWAETSSAAGTLKARRNRIWDAANGINIGAATAQKFYLSNNSVLTLRANGAASSAGIIIKSNTDVAVENNLVTGGASGALSVSRPAPTGAFTDRTNVWHTTAPSGMPIVWNGGAMTLAQYKTASAQTTSTDADPKLSSTNAASPDFRLTSTSPARDFGVTNPYTGTLTPGCDGAVDHYCGAAPEAGALELLSL